MGSPTAPWELTLSDIERYSQGHPDLECVNLVEEPS